VKSPPPPMGRLLWRTGPVRPDSLSIMHIDMSPTFRLSRAYFVAFVRCLPYGR
jgi:hypothetical protein